MSEIKQADEKYVVCEFFGLQIATKDAETARILTADIGEFLHREIHVTRPDNNISDGAGRSILSQIFRINLHLRKPGA